MQGNEIGRAPPGSAPVRRVEGRPRHEAADLARLVEEHLTGLDQAGTQAGAGTLHARLGAGRDRPRWSASSCCGTC